MVVLFGKVVGAYTDGHSQTSRSSKLKGVLNGRACDDDMVFMAFWDDIIYQYRMAIV